MEYFSSSLRMHRHFDWYIYNYLFERKLKHAETARMITDQAESNQLNVNWRVEKIDALLIKVLQETKFAVTDAVVEEEKKLLKEKQTTFELFKFFREIKVHNVEEVPVILSPFKRVVQFANIE